MLSRKHAAPIDSAPEPDVEGARVISALPPANGQTRVGAGEFTVALRQQWQYQVQWAPGLIATYGSILRAQLGARAVVVLTDETVHELYAGELARSFADADLSAQW